MPRLSTIGSAATGAYGFGTLIPPVIANYIVVGGTGNVGGNFGGGGGSGQVQIVSALLSRLTNYTVVVGSATNSSSFNGTTAAGGVNGQDTNPVDSTNIDGGASGSGNSGGAGARIYLGPYNSPYGAGGGGGQGAVGGGGSAVDSPPYTSGVYTGGNGGAGVVWSVNGVYYGGGGGGQAQAGGHGSSSGGSNGTGYNPFGSLNGGVIVSYTSATQLYTGGTVTSTGTGASTVWFHTFTTVGTSTLTHL